MRPAPGVNQIEPAGQCTALPLSGTHANYATSRSNTGSYLSAVHGQQAPCQPLCPHAMQQQPHPLLHSTPCCPSCTDTAGSPEAAAKPCCHTTAPTALQPFTLRLDPRPPMLPPPSPLVTMQVHPAAASNPCCHNTALSAHQPRTTARVLLTRCCMAEQAH